MRLVTVGCSFRNTSVDLRERLAFAPHQLPQSIKEVSARYDCETVILSTCNRVELYLARPGSPTMPDAEGVADFLGEVHRVPIEQIRPHLYECRGREAVHHLFRVVASLDSLIIGEGQIAGQVKRAYELAHELNCAGSLLHALFQHAHRVAKRVRTETGIARGHASVSSAAVDYVRQVFAHFGDKTILVIGAGKMGELTLRHLRQLNPQRILVTNRSPEKAEVVARACGGQARSWEQLDSALAAADIILSTTGASEPIVSRRRWDKILPQRKGSTAVILDIAVPRDFDPRIHDGDRTCLFNIDDLKRIREATLQDRLTHVGPAEAIIEEETSRFLRDWARRSNGSVIARLTQDVESKRQAIVQQLLAHLNGRLTDADRAYIEKAFSLFQNQVLHGPISALTEEIHENPTGHGGHTLLEALRKLFRLQEQVQ